MIRLVDRSWEVVYNDYSLTMVGTMNWTNVHFLCVAGNTQGFTLLSWHFFFIFPRIMRNRWDSFQSFLLWCTTLSREELSSSTWTAWWMTQWKFIKPGNLWMSGLNMKKKSLKKSKLRCLWLSEHSPSLVWSLEDNMLSFQVCSAPQEFWPDCFLSGEEGKRFYKIRIGTNSPVFEVDYCNRKNRNNFFCFV